MIAQCMRMIRITAESFLLSFENSSYYSVTRMIIIMEDHGDITNDNHSQKDGLS